MHDFLMIWNSLSMWEKVFLLCTIAGGVTFSVAWVVFVRQAQQSTTLLNQLLDLVEKNAPDVFRSFYTGNMIHRKHRFLNRHFRKFLQSRQLDELPEIAEVKRSYLLKKQSDARMLKCITGSFCLMIVGAFGMFLCISQFGHP